jgi:hypothetical protein
MGEVAAAMGWVQDEELVTGLYAGQRSLRSAHSMRLQMQTDSRRTHADGLTFREAAQERHIARQVEDRQSDSWRELNEGAVAGASAVAGGYRYVRDGHMIQDLRTRRDRVFEAVSDRWQQIKRAPGAFATEVKERVESAPTRHPAADTLHAHAAAIAVAHDWLAPDQRYHAYSLDEGGKLRAEQPHSGGTIPADALTVANVHVNVTRLLRQGYVVQQNRNKTVTFWHRDAEQAAAARLSPDQERAQLINIKAVTEEGIKQALAQAPTAPASSAQGGKHP